MFHCPFDTFQACMRTVKFTKGIVDRCCKYKIESALQGNNMALTSVKYGVKMSARQQQKTGENLVLWTSLFQIQ